MLEQNLYNLTEKYNIFMSIEEEDKKRFKNIISWAGDMMEMTVKEKYSRSIQPIRGEIWTCHFGENVGSEVNKVRPALIISDDLGNCKSPTVTVIPITSREARQVTHVEIAESDLAFVENVVKGTITAEGLRNVSKARLGRRIGKFNIDFMKRVEQSIKIALGFSDLEVVNEVEEVELLEVANLPEKVFDFIPLMTTIEETEVEGQQTEPLSKETDELPKHVQEKLRKKEKYERSQRNRKKSR